MKFELKGRDFSEINPNLKMSRLNIMAFVSKIQEEQPARVEITHDGSLDAMKLLTEIAGEVSYFANIEGTIAVFERV